MTSPVDDNYLKWVEAKRNEQDKTAVPAEQKAGHVWGYSKWAAEENAACDASGRTSAPQRGERQA